MKSEQGMVFNIQKFSLHDGPGIRTTVFLKGCSLRCFWCHNPESWNAVAELQVFGNKCIGCGKCAALCPNGAHRLQGREPGTPVKVFVRENCKGCGACAANCPSGCLVLTGEVMTADEVMRQVEADRAFYETSGGGVTFSGGEPLLQAAFLRELLARCKKAGFHTAVDTAGNVSWESFSGILAQTDLFLYDLKAFDEQTHLKATGRGNVRILENLRKLSEKHSNIIIRIPVIKGVNDAGAEMESIAGFIKDLGNVKYTELLPFHRFASNKYESLGLEYKAGGYETHSRSELEAFAEIFRIKGLEVKI